MIQEILKTDDPAKILPLFQFRITESEEVILFKYNLWGRFFFPKYYKSKDAPFHKEIDQENLKVYRAQLKSFTDIAFRGAAKSVRTKLFVAFCIANDLDHFRRYFKALSKDLDNSKQIVTDIYNMFVDYKVKRYYPEIFAKTEAKREEKMEAFTTATGIKLTADTVGTDQRGQVQEDSRPDFIWFEDFETRKTLRSAVETKAIWDNMEEARTGLSKDGGCVYTCNYISEAGNVHKLVTKENTENKVLIVPILKDGKPAWDFYTLAEIEQMKKDDEDFEGERMCRPSSSKDVYFDRPAVEKMPILDPIRDIAGFKMFREYKAGHRYAGGHDVAGGVGLDSSTSVFIDFDTIPAQVVGTYHSNTILPEAFGDEVYSQGNRFGGCILGIENNKFDQAILKAKLLRANLFFTPQRELKIGYAAPATYGWNTNSLTKSKMLSSLRSAIEDGLIELNDKDLIQEVKGYTRNDLIDNVPDPRLTTRHFDLLTALAIAWQMKDYARPRKLKDPQDFTQKEVNIAV